MDVVVIVYSSVAGVRCDSLESHPGRVAGCVHCTVRGWTPLAGTVGTKCAVLDCLVLCAIRN